MKEFVINLFLGNIDIRSQTPPQGGFKIQNVKKLQNLKILRDEKLFVSMIISLEYQP
jgi:hypothetical protein